MKKIYPNIKVGDKFGLLSVIGIEDKRIKCQCECGDILYVYQNSLIHQNVKSCRSYGCRSKAYGINIGDRFNTLTVFGVYNSPRDSSISKFSCKCDCGQISARSAKSLIKGAAYCTYKYHDEVLKNETV